MNLIDKLLSVDKEELTKECTKHITVRTWND